MTQHDNAEAGGPEFNATPTPAFGKEMRALRKVRGLTLKELSATTGISLSYLSVIERDAANPSRDVLSAIADALGVDVGWFFAAPVGVGPLERDSVVRADRRRNLNLLYGTPSQEAGFTDQLLSRTIGGGFYLSQCTFAPGADRPLTPLITHDGEQHALVTKGAIELTLEGEVIVLQAGDSYSFDTSIPHRVRNALRDAESVLVWAVSHVVIPRDLEKSAN